MAEFLEGHGEKKKTWIYLAGALASIIALWYIYKQRATSTSILQGSGTTGATGSAGTAAQQANALLQAQALQNQADIAKASLAVQTHGQDLAYSLGVAQLQTQLGVSNNQKATTLGSQGISAGSNLLGQAMKALLSGGSGPNTDVTTGIPPGVSPQGFSNFLASVPDPSTDPSFGPSASAFTASTPDWYFTPSGVNDNYFNVPADYVSMPPAPTSDNYFDVSSDSVSVGG